MIRWAATLLLCAILVGGSTLLAASASASLGAGGSAPSGNPAGAAAKDEAPPAPDQILYPHRAASSGSSSSGHADLGGFTLVLAVLAAGAGAWLYWRGRKDLRGSTARGKLMVAETRSLGSRQYLVVASYGEKKYLLGVCPGRIDLLAPLDEDRPSASS